MKVFYTILTLLFFTVGLGWYVSVICQDLSHPEVWSEDWTHDPRIYLPLMVVVLPLCGFVWWREVRKTQRKEAELQALKQRLGIMAGSPSLSDSPDQ